MNWKGYVIIALTLLVGGFILGRWAIPQREPKVEYRYLPAIKGSISSSELSLISSTLEPSIKFIPVYITEQGPVNTEQPEELVQLSTVIDTLASYRKTVEDWNIERVFGSTLFDTPNLGKFSWTGKVQYNTMTAFDWVYTPVQRTEIVIPPKRVIEPFMRASYNSFNQYTLGGGVYYKNIGVEVFYVNDIKLGVHGVGGAVSFKF